VLSRTASFAFLLGDRHFGVITAYVDGPRAEDYVFTSSLPLQVLRYLDPTLASLLRDPGDAASSLRSASWYDAVPEEEGLADPHARRIRSAPVPGAGVRAPGRLGPGA
jgi:hypothetical protein